MAAAAPYLQQCLVVCANIDGDWQAEGGVDPSTGRVQRQAGHGHANGLQCTHTHTGGQAIFPMPMRHALHSRPESNAACMLQGVCHRFLV